tara:strand:+ start:1610 stop:2692 length:1083 start_codon:yes stop_codon:yes gene_type:complete
MSSPDDISGLKDLLGTQSISCDAIKCILMKTEGNGLDNDFSRQLATRSVLDMIASNTDWSLERIQKNITLLASGGCEGIVSPHMIIYTKQADARPSSYDAVDRPPTLAIGRSVSAPCKPIDVGTENQARETRNATYAAMADAGLTPDQVRYVLVKGAIPDDAGIRQLKGVLSPHALKSAMRAASAVGVGMALGDIKTWENDPSIPGEGPICGRVCVTASADSPESEIIVFGMSSAWQSNFVVTSGHMIDMIDTPAFATALSTLGLNAAPQLSAADRDRLAAILVKGEPPSRGMLRDRRHVMWRDSDINAFRHFRAAMGGCFAALTGETRIYASAGAERQVANGGLSFAIFARTSEGDLHV